MIGFKADLDYLKKADPVVVEAMAVALLKIQQDLPLGYGAPLFAQCEPLHFLKETLKKHLERR